MLAKMKHLISVLFTVITSAGCFAQNGHDIKVCLAFDLFQLDTINIKHSKGSFVKIDTSKVLNDIDLYWYSYFQMQLDSSLTLFSDTVGLDTRKAIIAQATLSNQRKWNEYEDQCRLIILKKKSKAFSNYSLPIEISNTISVVYHFWHFDSHYAGVELIFIEYNESQAFIVKREIIWSS